MLQAIKKFLVTWNELLTIPLAFLLWSVSDDLIRLVDSTAAAYDGAIFQKILFAMIAILFFNGFAWLLLKINFPKVYKYLDNSFESNLDNQNGNLTAWQKSKLCLLLFALYFLALALLLNARF